MTRSAAFPLLVLAAIAATTAQPQPARAAACPDVSGHYRPYSGTGSPDADAAKALRITFGIFLGSELRLEGRPEEGLDVYMKVGESGKFPGRPNLVLKRGTDFSCKDGALVFDRVPNTSRKTDDAFYEGSSTVRLLRGGGSGLVVEVVFSGLTRSTIYSYDSARISVPNLGTGKTLRDTLRWPPASEPENRPAITKPVEPPEPPEVVNVRAIFNHTMVGGLTLATVRASGDAVLVTLRAPRNDDIARLEDRLLGAAIRYEMTGPPRWEGQGYYHLQLRVWPTGTGSPKAVRPSVHRVEQELTQVRYGFDVRKVEDVGDGYVATLGIPGTDDAEGIVGVITRNTKMFAEIRLLNDPGRTDSPRTRVVQIKLRER